MNPGVHNMNEAPSSSDSDETTPQTKLDSIKVTRIAQAFSELQVTPKKLENDHETPQHATNATNQVDTKKESESRSYTYKLSTPNALFQTAEY